MKKQKIKHINHKEIKASIQHNVIIDGCINCTIGSSMWGNCIRCSNNARIAQKVIELKKHVEKKSQIPKKRIRTVRTYNNTTVKLVCLICEEPMSYIPLGQRHKLAGTQPVFYHERCCN